MVRQLLSLAARYGLRSWRAIYEHPENVDLKERRSDPNIVYPGDRVVIPDVSSKSLQLTTDQVHRVRVRKNTIVLRLELELEQPELESADYELDVEGRSEPLTGTLDAGRLEHEIPARATRAELRLLHPKGGVLRTFVLQIGHLDPPDTPTGIQARLRRLGYACGDADGVIGPRTRAALRAFRAAHGVDDPEQPFGDATSRALVDVLGH